MISAMQELENLLSSPTWHTKLSKPTNASKGDLLNLLKLIKIKAKEPYISVLFDNKLRQGNTQNTLNFLVELYEVLDSKTKDLDLDDLNIDPNPCEPDFSHIPIEDLKEYRIYNEQEIKANHHHDAICKKCGSTQYIMERDPIGTRLRCVCGGQEFVDLKNYRNMERLAHYYENALNLICKAFNIPYSLELTKQ